MSKLNAAVNNKCVLLMIGRGPDHRLLIKMSDNSVIALKEQHILMKFLVKEDLRILHFLNAYFTVTHLNGVKEGKLAVLGWMRNTEKSFYAEVLITHWDTCMNVSWKCVKKLMQFPLLEIYSIIL